MSKKTEPGKVIVINAGVLKVLKILLKLLISLVSAIAGGVAVSFFMPYYEYGAYGMVNNYSISGAITFIVVFYLMMRKRLLTRILTGIGRFNQNYIMRSIGVEIFVANINSFLIAIIVFWISGFIGKNIITALIWAVFAYYVVLQLLTRKKIGYIREIADGILEISKGNLDYKVAEMGNDELRILAENINKMSGELKRKIEDEKRAEQTKNELITNVSHDLKTPLTTIIGYLTLVKDKTYDNEKVMDDYIEKAYSKSLKLKKLIEDLFEYTKISNGVIKVHKSDVNLVELMEQLLGEMSVIAKQNNLSIESDYSHPEIIVNIDSDLIARTFENILSNAIKYSYKELNGKILVKVVKDDSKATIVVENQGDTIPTEILPLIFERFYRVDKSRSSKIVGSGLGLAISKSIIELHGGTIYAESEANKVRVCVVLNETSFRGGFNPR